jgi:hypothetical protein
LAVRHGLEDRAHVGAHALGRPGAVAGGVRIQRQAAVEGHQLVEVGRGAQQVETPVETLGAAGQQQQHARRLVHAPGLRVPARTRVRGRRQVGGVERQRRLAQAPRHQADVLEQCALVRGARQRLIQPAAGSGIQLAPKPALQQIAWVHFSHGQTRGPATVP